MNDLILNIPNLKEEYTEHELKELIAACSGKVKVIVPLTSIGVTNWSVNIASDYLDALFVGETIAKFCKSIAENYEDKSIHFVLKPKDIEGLTTVLLWLASAFNGDGEEEEVEHVRSYITDFEENLEQKNIRFHEIADSYLANFVNGIEGFDEEEYIDNLYREHPEWRYKFWRSFTSKKLKYGVYASAFAWIIPHNSHGDKSSKIAQEVLRKYAGFENSLPAFQEAQCLSIGTLPPIVFNQYAMSSYPYRGIEAAQACASVIWQRRSQENWLKGLPKRVRELQTSVQCSEWPPRRDSLSLRLSEDGIILIARDDIAQYLFFRESYGLSEMAERYDFLSEDRLIDIYVKGEGEKLWALPQKFQRQYMDAIDKISETLNSLEGNPVSIKLPWQKLNDDTFEQLCYDIIGQSEVFDPDTRRRMGKSHSRDGGRDIEIYSRKRIGIFPTKWIAQCKFTKRGRSLAGSNIQVSDVIDQYGAGGFCIMTNAPIDSTLHDKLERIAFNRKIEFDEWDGMRIERLLARPRYRNIKKRYFGI